MTLPVTTVEQLLLLLLSVVLCQIGHAQNITIPINSRCNALAVYRFGTCRLITCPRNEYFLPGNSYCDIYSRPFGRRLVRCVANLPCCSLGGECKPVCGGLEENSRLRTDCNARTGFCCVPRNASTTVTPTTLTTPTPSPPNDFTLRPSSNSARLTVAQLQGRCGRNTAVAPRIVGGSVTRPTDWPWMVRLVYKSSPRSVCAGVLVDDDTVVTVAHCINGFTAGQIDVLVGDHDVTRVDPGEELIPANSTEMSRDYVPGVRGFDFAIIKLARKVNFTATKLAACLPDSTIPILPPNDPNSQCFVTGWGVDDSGRVSSQLRSAPVQLMDLRTCNRILTSLGAANVSQVPTDMICSDTSATRSDACLFDDGGALTCRDTNSRFTLLGLVSEYTCGSLPAIYTRVDNYTSAILTRL